MVFGKQIRKKLDCITNLRKGRYDWNIKVRVIRKWNIKHVVGFNLLLLDDKDCRIHAFVPNDLAPKFYNFITVGDVYVVANFSVKSYTEKDKHLPIQTDQQIMFTTYTTVEHEPQGSSLISINAFDFYDIADLEQMADQTKYLVDVIGVVEDLQPLRQFKNTKSQDAREQCYVKLLLTDGRFNVNVTLWDDCAQSFQNSLNEDLELPLIVIIASGNVTHWRGHVEVSNWFTHTRFYINYNHHTIAAMRRMLIQPFFTDYQLSSQTLISNKIYELSELSELGEQYINKKVIVRVKISKLKTSYNWVLYECTSCQKEVRFDDQLFHCLDCKRTLQFPDEKYTVATICSDNTGSILIIISDRDIRRLTGTIVYHLQTPYLAEGKSSTFPAFLKDLMHKSITAVLQINEDNIRNKSNVFMASEIEDGNHFEPFDNNSSMQFQLTSTTEASTSSYHLDHLETNMNTSTTNSDPSTSKSRTMRAFKLTG